MKWYSFTAWQTILIFLGVLSLLTATYATILINNLKTPEAADTFLRGSNTYYYVSEIIKAKVRDRYPPSLEQNIIKLKAADTILSYIATPSNVERVALPLIKIRARVAKMPLSFDQNSLVLDTKKYTQQASQTVSTLALPQALKDAANSLILSVPQQIAIVDSQKNPNSILISITNTRMLFETIKTVNTIAWIVFIVSLIALVITMFKSLARLTYALLLMFSIPAIIGVLVSYLLPYLAGLFYSSPDPVAGLLKDQMWQGILWHYFMFTRQASFIYLLISFVLFLLYKFVPFQKVQEWTNTHILMEKKKKK